MLSLLPLRPGTPSSLAAVCRRRMNYLLGGGGEGGAGRQRRQRDEKRNHRDASCRRRWECGDWVGTCWDVRNVTTLGYWHCSHSMRQGLSNDTVSVYPSVCSSVCLSYLAPQPRFCCSVPGQWEISIDSGGRRVPSAICYICYIAYVTWRGTVWRLSYPCNLLTCLTLSETCLLLVIYRDKFPQWCKYKDATYLPGGANEHSHT